MILSLSFLLLGAALSLALCRFALPLGQWLKVMDLPSCGDGHKRHARPTPAVGGVIFGISGSILLVAYLPWSEASEATGERIRLIALAAILAVMIVGYIDDRKHIPALKRLTAGIVISTILLLLVPRLQLHQVSFPSLNLQVQTGIFAIPFTILCLQALKNAVNMADGRNGLLLGMSIIWTIFFLTHALPHMIPTMTGLLGCLLVLFFFNIRGKLFMGDCGAYGIAKYFGILALSLHQNAYGNVRSAEVVLLFLIPVLDIARLIVVRLYNGRSPMAPDGQHLHHLLDRAIGWKLGWFVYMALVAVPIVAYQLHHGLGIHIILLATGAYFLVVLGCVKADRLHLPSRRSDRDSQPVPSPEAEPS